jgi:hypothetical protein
MYLELMLVGMMIGYGFGFVAIIPMIFIVVVARVYFGDADRRIDLCISQMAKHRFFPQRRSEYITGKSSHRTRLAQQKPGFPVKREVSYFVPFTTIYSNASRKIS